MTQSTTTTSKTMHATLFYGPGDIRYEEIQTPKFNENEILVKVDTVLTGGTDLKTFKRGHPVLIKTTPSLFGHQFSGVVVEVGSKVKDFKSGDKIVAMNSVPCYKCAFCNIERYSLCENIEFLNGAYAEYITLPERIVKHNTYKVPNDISLKHAAILESLAVITHGYEKTKVPKKGLSGKSPTVCVIGTGSIGLLFVAYAKKRGANVISIGRTDRKLKIAKEIGADHTINMTGFSSSEILTEEIKKLTNGFGPEVVIEAVGQPDVWELATKLVSKGGTVNFFGGCKKGTTVQLDTYKLHYEELNLIGVFHHTPSYVKQALEILSDLTFCKNIIDKIVTHTVPLKDLEKAFLLQESGEAIQVAVKPSP